MATFKRGKICKCGCDFWEKTHDSIDGVWQPVWQCPNCNDTQPRRINKRRAGKTPAQQKAIDFALKYAMGDRNPTEYELYDIKEETNERGEITLTFRIRYNVPGTIGYAYPEFRMVFIGRKGGYTVFHYEKGASKAKTLHGIVALIYSAIH